jgi:hypothetical protein
MNFSRHFYSEWNKLEKSPSKIGGGVSFTLLPLCDAGGGGGEFQCDFDQKCCIWIILGSMRHHFRILKIALLFHTVQNKSGKKYSCSDDAYMYLTVKNLN